MNARKHFHTLDALRFFAFFKVFLLHIPIFSFPAFNFIKKGGGIGVLFFFVLSGFLITYILLHEKCGTGSIDLRRFFLRRILRIWPLYYLLVGVAFLTPYLLSYFQIPHSDEGYEPNWIMTIAFLENYQMMLMNNHPNVSPLGVTWSLCIEEHFYILWGILLFVTPIKKLPLLIGVCILCGFLFRAVYGYFQMPKMDILTNIDYFAYGAIPAYFYVIHKEFMNKILSGIPIFIKISTIMLVVAYAVISPNIDYEQQRTIEPLLFGISFILVICSILPNKKALVISDKHVISRLGMYTYGLYLYHTLVINMMIHVYEHLGLSTDIAVHAITFSMISLMLTVVVSIISYHYFEKYFLMLKERFWKDKAVVSPSGLASVDQYTKRLKK